MPMSRRAREERGRASGSRRGPGAGGGSPLWLRTVPDMDHVPEDYGNAPDEHGVAPATYQALERYLPSTIRGAPKDQKMAVMRRVLVGDQDLLRARALLRVRRIQRQYREAIQSAYQPLHHELFSLNPSAFFVPSFLQAVYSNTEDGFRTIMTELAPGLYVFAMLQPAFCQMLKAEVDHFLRWAYVMNQNIMMANTMDQRSVDLSDFGLETMLDDLMKGFVSPIATVLYPELGASSLDSHCSSVVDYAEGQGEGFHVDDSEVTLNVCIGGEFNGGDLYFRGIRCVDHVNSEIHNEFQELVQYSQTLGQAMLYRGRHRHGAHAITSGLRTTLQMWCRSSLARKILKYQTDFTSWCGKCQSES